MTQPTTTSSGRAVAYLRVSTISQDTHGANLDSQLDEIQAYCRRKGYTLRARDVYRDVVSGARTDRAGYYDLLRRIEARDVDVVVAYAVSRFGRNTLDTAWLLSKAKEYGIRLETVQGGTDYTADPEAELLFDIMSAVAKYERMSILRTMGRGKRKATERGYWAKGVPPYGYAAVGPRGSKTLKPTSDADVVKWMFAQYAAGSGYKAISDQLHARAPTDHAGKPRKWSPKIVGEILAHPVYVGLLPHDDGVVEGQHDALVSQDEWDAVQARRATMRRRHPGRPRNNDD